MYYRHNQPTNTKELKTRFTKEEILNAINTYCIANGCSVDELFDSVEIEKEIAIKDGVLLQVNLDNELLTSIVIWDENNGTDLRNCMYVMSDMQAGQIDADDVCLTDWSHMADYIPYEGADKKWSVKAKNRFELGTFVVWAQNSQSAKEKMESSGYTVIEVNEEEE